MSDSFADQVDAWIEKTNGNADEILRAVSLELLNRVVTRSPVGNPELWAANQHAVYARKTFNLFAERAGAKPLKPSTLAKRFPLTAGKGYVGGRFRGNWQVTIDTPATQAVDSIDASGSKTLANGAAALADAEMGQIIFLVNNLPYAERLEEGWSKQAPAGMVRVTVAEFNGVVENAVAEVTKE